MLTFFVLHPAYCKQLWRRNGGNFSCAERRVGDRRVEVILISCDRRLTGAEVIWSSLIGQLGCKRHQETLRRQTKQNKMIKPRKAISSRKDVALTLKSTSALQCFKQLCYMLLTGSGGIWLKTLCKTALVYRSSRCLFGALSQRSWLFTACVLDQSLNFLEKDGDFSSCSINLIPFPSKSRGKLHNFEAMVVTNLIILKEKELDHSLSSFKEVLAPRP